MKHRLWAIICLLLLMGWSTATATFAHSDLVKATPKPGASVQTTISEIRLTFSEPTTAQSSILLFGEGFEIIPLTTLLDETNPRTIYAPLEQELQLGNYTVQWTAVSADGHEISGSYQFSVSNQPAWFNLSTLLPVVGVFIVLSATVFIWRQKWGMRTPKRLPRK